MTKISLYIVLDFLLHPYYDFFFQTQKNKSYLLTVNTVRLTHLHTGMDCMHSCSHTRTGGVLNCCVIAFLNSALQPTQASR